MTTAIVILVIAGLWWLIYPFYVHFMNDAYDWGAVKQNINWAYCRTVLDHRAWQAGYDAVEQMRREHWEKAAKHWHPIVRWLSRRRLKEFENH